MSGKSPYRPTRNCPHRACPWLHWLYLPIALTLLTQLLLAGPVSIVFTVCSWLLGTVAHTLVQRKSLREMAEQMQLDSAVVGHLVVRPVWAAVAVGIDALYVAVGSALVAWGLGHPGVSPLPVSVPGGYVRIVVSVGLSLFCWFAHRQATRPVKPKRVLVPVLGSTG